MTRKAVLAVLVIGISVLCLVPAGFAQTPQRGGKADQKKATEKLVKMISDEALIIPLWKEPVAVMTQNYVHTIYHMRGFIHGHLTTTGWKSTRQEESLVREPKVKNPGPVIRSRVFLFPLGTSCRARKNSGPIARLGP